MYSKIGSCIVTTHNLNLFLATLKTYIKQMFSASLKNLYEIVKYV
jgi:hypothetical protein